ncbi:MAG: ABC transporter ATP-binding protein [Rhodanobacter sp.]
MHNEGEAAPAAAPDPAPPASGPLHEISQLSRAVKRLFGAQFDLLAAELGLARSAISWLFVAALAATVAGVGFGLTTLGLLGVLLVKWLGSWVWALLVLAVLELLFLVAAIVLFRRCMHWMTLPATRAEWSAMMHDSARKVKTEMAEGTAADRSASHRRSSEVRE